MSRSNYKKIFLLTVLVLITLLAVRMTSLKREELTPLETAVKDSLAPVQEVTIGFARGLHDMLSSAANLGHLAEENKKLKQEVRELKSRLDRVEEYKVQNRRLKEMLQYREFTVDKYKLMTAAVIGRDPGNWFGTITVNRGANDGVDKDMAVIVPGGLVGRVVAVSKHTAEVLLITDPRSGVAAVVQQSQEPGVVEGVANSTGMVRMIHLRRDAPVKPGQVVVSSGVGGIYPSGVRIGKIISTENDPGGLFQTAAVEPFVDLRVLREVFIVTAVYTPEVNLPLEGNE
ncbi:rod shape-determining protein MreC [Desulfohalotomaculum tongense]|uniref:rod shape-determining protein MreC n=1 Tax=Desulforadius tongensis TaxID=1216062 RepID=UPI0019564868|nr:rod shape-determining protein MreC [Desulforadius tongensis]MBM7854530.1 rod shape-determining protein MreC [Desulforadius tongensis]